MPESVQVWHADLDVGPSCLETLAASLSEDEQARAARFHFERDRKRWIAARGLLRAALGRLLAISPPNVCFKTGPFGKPSLCDSPLRFNLSHADNQMLMAFAWGREVGVDIERRRDDFSPLELAPQVFSSAERQFLHAVPTEDRHQAFLMLWTAKEAYVKASEEGLSFPLSRLTLLPPPAGSRQWSVTDETAGTDRPVFEVHTLPTGVDHLAALAVEPLPLALFRGTNIVQTSFSI